MGRRVEIFRGDLIHAFVEFVPWRCFLAMEKNAATVSLEAGEPENDLPAGIQTRKISRMEGPSPSGPRMVKVVPRP